MANVEEQVQILQRHLNAFLEKRTEMIDFLNHCANTLDEHNKNVKITKVVTGSTGIGGTLISLAGIVLAGPTGGLSLVLTFCGGILATASGAAHLGSDLVERILTKTHLNKLDRLCQTDEENFIQLNNYLRQFVTNLRNNTFRNYISSKTQRNAFQELASLTNLTYSVVRITRVASSTGRSIRVFSAVSFISSER
ncbi:unnamed protein product [Rotaria sordida]|uniref:Uncharacterized protein n=1 Tax=Rotaria sordida TaxID=392033 RepID=A0A819DF77_9BILA|nr:unnamed protein product [Rotaria sordida]CAF1138918.1 unnamed protein product [Rotaria sordida]CAF3836741.1 unnamed protein product [Rotaria sordida]CAF3856016.1 unnamed protein product [Rotaria sordida]